MSKSPKVWDEVSVQEFLYSSLAKNAQSRRRLSDKLRQRGVETELAERVLDQFEELGLIDDAQLAADLAASLQRQYLLVNQALLQKICARGIPRALAETAVSDLMQEVDQEALALQLAEKLYRRNNGSANRAADPDNAAEQKAVNQKIGRTLIAKGYSFDIVQNVLASLGP
jgi:regulatory protein